VDYSGWTKDANINEMIARLLHNYSIKVNEELGRYKREKFNISIGDELPAGVLKLAKVYLAKKRKLESREINLQEDTETRVLFPE
jgi:DNA-directed RNA polymerase subunit beta